MGDNVRGDKEFKGQDGHCNVPCSYPENPELGKWVARQLSTGRLSLSQERASKLDSIGFTWGTKIDVTMSRERVSSLDSIDLV